MKDELIRILVSVGIRKGVIVSDKGYSKVMVHPLHNNLTEKEKIAFVSALRNEYKSGFNNKRLNGENIERDIRKYLYDKNDDEEEDITLSSNIMNSELIRCLVLILEFKAKLKHSKYYDPNDISSDDIALIKSCDLPDEVYSLVSKESNAILLNYAKRIFNSKYNIGRPNGIINNDTSMTDKNEVTNSNISNNNSSNSNISNSNSSNSNSSNSNSSNSNSSNNNSSNSNSSNINSSNSNSSNSNSSNNNSNEINPNDVVMVDRMKRKEIRMNFEQFSVASACITAYGENPTQVTMIATIISSFYAEQVQNTISLIVNKAAFDSFVEVINIFNLNEVYRKNFINAVGTIYEDELPDYEKLTKAFRLNLLVKVKNRISELKKLSLQLMTSENSEDIENNMIKIIGELLQFEKAFTFDDDIWTNKDISLKVLDRLRDFSIVKQSINNESLAKLVVETARIKIEKQIGENTFVYEKDRNSDVSEFKFNSEVFDSGEWECGTVRLSFNNGTFFGPMFDYSMGLSHHLMQLGLNFGLILKSNKLDLINRFYEDGLIKLEATRSVNAEFASAVMIKYLAKLYIYNWFNICIAGRPVRYDNNCTKMTLYDNSIRCLSHFIYVVVNGKLTVSELQQIAGFIDCVSGNNGIHQMILSFMANFSQYYSHLPLTAYFNNEKVVIKNIVDSTPSNLAEQFKNLFELYVDDVTIN